jgi:hypothetical protein
MIPSRWSSAIAILRRRLYEAAAERRQLLDELRASERSERERADPTFDRRDEAAVEYELFGKREVGRKEAIPFEPADPTAQRGVGPGDAVARSQRFPQV